MTPLQQMLVMYGSVVLLVLLLINVYTKNFLLKYAVVRMSNGRRVLLFVRSKNDVYLTTGKIKEGMLYYRTRDKDKKIIPNVREGTVGRSIGISWMFTDEEKNCFFDVAVGKDVTGMDAVKMDELLQRCLMRTGADEIKKWLMIIAILSGIALLAAGYAAFLAQKNAATLAKIAEVVLTQAQVVPVGG